MGLKDEKGTYIELKCPECGNIIQILIRDKELKEDKK